MPRASICVFLALSVLASSACFAEKRLPISLGKVSLGEIPSETVLLSVTGDAVAVQAASRVRDLKPAVAAQMLRALLPLFRSSSASGNVTLYQRRVVSLNLFLPDIQFKHAQRAIFRRFGKGSSYESLISEVPDGCEPYMFDQWGAGRLGLFLVGAQGKAGVSVHLRDNDLNYKMAEDDSVHIESEQCIEF